MALPGQWQPLLRQPQLTVWVTFIMPGLSPAASAVQFNPTSSQGTSPDNKIATTGAIFLTKIGSVTSDYAYGYTYLIEADQPLIVNAQPKSILLAKIATDSANDVYLLGSFNGIVNFNPTGGNDFYNSNGETWQYLMEIKADGTYGQTWIWQNPYISIRDMTLDSKDNIYLGGSVTNNSGNPIQAQLDPLTASDSKTVNDGETMGFYIKIASSFGKNWTGSLATGSDYWMYNAMSQNGKYQVAVRTLGDLFTSDDYGKTWIDQSSLGSKNWTGVSISSDGEYQTAITTSDYIYASNDYGRTWTARTSAGTSSWLKISMSEDGKYQNAVDISSGYNHIYSSSDYGVTWTEQSQFGNRSWMNIAMSADGKYQAAEEWQGDLYTSNDYGATWNQQVLGGGLKFWQGLAISADGKYQTATNNSDAGIYYSSDYGTTWNEQMTSGINGWSRIFISANGKYRAAVSYSSSNLYTSNDYGATWNQQSSVPIGSWNVALSDDGKYQTAIWQSVDIETSNDYGTTWTPQASSGTKNWYDIAMSSDGNYTTVLESNINGKLYTSSKYVYAYSQTFTNTAPQVLEVDHLVVDPSGNVFLLGVFSGTVNFNGSGGTETSNNNSNDIFLSKYDDSVGLGSYVSTYVIGGDGQESAGSLAIDTNGDIFYSGGFSPSTSPVEFDPIAGQPSDTGTATVANQLFLTKLNGDGTYGYTVSWNTSSLSINKIAFDSNHLVYLIGVSAGPLNYDPTGGTDTQNGFGLNDGFLTVLHPDKTYNYSYVWGGTDDEKAMDAAFDQSDNLFIVGSTKSLSINFDPTGATDIPTLFNGGENGYITQFSSVPYVSPTPTPTNAPQQNNNSNSSSNSNSNSSPTCTGTPPSTPSIFQIWATKTQATMHFVPSQGQQDTYTISYGPYSGADMYNVTFNYSDKSGAIPYAINALNPATVYYFKVRGNNGCVPGPWSNILSLRTAYSVGSTSKAYAYNATVNNNGSAGAGGTCSEYTVVPGDSFWAIAAKLLGAGAKYFQLWDANKARFPSLNYSSIIRVGWTLSVGC